MRNSKLFRSVSSVLLAAMLMVVGCMQATAQGFQKEAFPDGSYSPVTNINRNGYPRVLADGSVMFRVNAPQAQKVQIDLCGTKYDMQKSDSGLWFVTTKPQVPGFHYYFLIVDGVSVADPASQSFYGCSRWSSAIEIQETGMDDFEVQNVPRGEVRTVYYFSNVDESWRPLMIYTPAGYNEGNQAYPVVYIQHGGGEDHRGWMEQGRTAQIMDNLIADGKIKPFIIVMTYGMTNGVRFGGLREFTAQEFETVLVDELIPYIDSHFRTKAKKESRAMAGLSMGGFETKLITLRRPEVFAYYGLLSGGQYAPSDIKDKNQVKMIFQSCGSKENPDGIKQSVEALKAAGFNAHGYISEGTAHEFLTWRRSLYQMAQLLFK